MGQDVKFRERIDLDEVRQACEKVKDEMRKAIIGQEEMMDLLIAAILANGHVLLEGVPGIAKTLTAKLIAKTLAINFSRIQFTPDLMPSDIIGTSIFNARKADFEFKQGPVFSNLVLIDEINRSPAKTQAALFEVMEERQITVDGITYPMDEPFIVIATQNPIEYEGTYRLPEAQIDRFLFKIRITYPGIEEEVRILNEFSTRTVYDALKEVKRILTGKKIVQFQSKIRSVHIDENLMRYIVKMIQNTRNHSSILLGGSPRASIAIMDSSKAYAALRGRDFVTPDDIKAVAFPALVHRIILTPEKEMEGKTPEDVITEIISEIEVPR